MFLRGRGGQATYHWGGVWHESAGLGVVQGDAIRNIWGTIERNQWGSGLGLPDGSGAFYTWDFVTNTPNSGGSNRNTAIGFDAARVVPTAPENRPVNVAVRYLMRALN